MRFRSRNCSDEMSCKKAEIPNIADPRFSSEESTIPIYLVDQLNWQDLLPEGQFAGRWARANGFAGKAGDVLIVPDNTGIIDQVVAGWEPDSDRFALARILHRLPPGDYHIESGLSDWHRDEAGLAALLAQQQTKDGPSVRLRAPSGINADRAQVIACAELMARRMINAPASEMNPGSLADAVLRVAQMHGAEAKSIVGEDLLASGFPLVHAVGRAAAEPPRLIDMRWGEAGPDLTIIGKGVCFDTGGLNLKPGRSMALMKKDMAGAAVGLALAKSIMEFRLPVRLRLLIPAVENSVSANAFRPGDILSSGSGDQVEITNTDAEGRLILADALTAAASEGSDLVLCFATLTGSARVAVGPDIVPFYTGSDDVAQILSEAADRVRDPIWRLPLWQPYGKMLDSHWADIANAADTPFAGSLTAALFLSRFAGPIDRFVHFDIYGWQVSNAPARPSGGIGQAWRAVLEGLPALLRL